MQNLAKVVPGRKPRRVAALRLAGAYRNLFAGNGSKEDADIVLSDLGAYTNFFGVTAPDAPDAAVRYTEGRRSVCGHILEKLAMTDQELAGLHSAARQETLLNEEEGTVL